MGYHVNVLVISSTHDKRETEQTDAEDFRMDGEAAVITEGFYGAACKLYEREAFATFSGFSSWAFLVDGAKHISFF